jgi:hypothetical protein
VADVIRHYGRAFLRTRRVPSSHYKVLRAIAACRTAALGGHRESCENCGFQRYAYNSCRNRHCPKCQALTKAQWYADRQAELLPVPYFHVVFTVPHKLNGLFLSCETNQREMLQLLFRAVSQTLTQFGKKNLGGRLGFMLILHTWDQLLRAHFHLHGVIPAGALSEDRSRWIDLPCEEFLFPVRALSVVFRAKFLRGVMRLLGQGKLRLSGKLAGLADPTTMRAFLQPLWNQDWVVYSKRPFGGPQKVLDYLGRYTHRVAISNHRLLSVQGGKVRFRYRDRRHGDVVKVAELPAEQFIGRFLQHVLPSGLMRIRHYGFLANRHKRESLAVCRRLLGAASPKEPSEKKDVRQWMLELTGIDIRRCPNCGHGSLLVEDLPVPEPHADPFLPIRAPP